jgi:hypothetical protein
MNELTMNEQEPALREVETSELQGIDGGYDPTIWSCPPPPCWNVPPVPKPTPRKFTLM